MQWNKLVISFNNQALAAAEKILIATGSWGNQINDQQFATDASQSVILTAYFPVTADFSKKATLIKQRLADLPNLGSIQESCRSQPV